MYKTQKIIIASVIFTTLSGCGLFTPKPPPTTTLPLPDTPLMSNLPQFVEEENEIQIADSFNDVDPTWVIGALVNTKNGNVRALDSFLKKGAKPKISPQSEIAFKNFIENSVATNAAWLDFVKGNINDKTRAEVTVAKTAKVSINNESIDKKLIINELKNIPASARADYGIIIGYSDYLLSASYFRNSGADAAASGYGAKIEGNWYSKFENSSIQHRIIAVWAPLPFVLEAINSQEPIDLTKSTADAIKKGEVNIEKFQSIIRIQ